MVDIKNFTPRLYQETILDTCIKKNCLVILPTGLGKTKTAILISTHRIKSYPSSKILFLTPTKPLAAQICREFKESTNIPEDQIVLFTGAVIPKKREELWENAKVAVSTPQGLENDIINNRISFKDVSCIVFDEAHRAVQDYAYTWLAKEYHKTANYPRIIGLTASPGSDLEKISEVCKNLYIEDIEVRTEEDPDVKQYVQEIDIDLVKIDLPEKFKEIKKFLENCLKTKLQKLKEYGAISSSNLSSITKKSLIQLQGQVHGKIARGEKDFTLWRVISLLAEATKVHHAVELIETQGVSSLHTYMKNIYQSAEKTKVKAVKNLASDLNFRSAYILTNKLYEQKIEHPKLDELKKIIQKEIEANPKTKIIVFNQYRDSAALIEKELNKIPKLKAKLFVGQLKKGSTGLSQKQQIAILKEFEAHDYNVLISTSIGEEGLDIPKVDLVIFYEPIPSAIRSIQRRGRTARTEKGKLIVLMTKNTRDEAYHWVSFHKEKRMHKVLSTIKEKLKLGDKKPQQSLKTFMQKKELKIFADTREKDSGIVKELYDLGVEIKTNNLVSADYIVSDRVGIELKTKPDFVNSIIDGRLLQQLKNLKQNFELPVLIIQGVEDIYSIRKVHPNSIRGMLATIAVSYGIPILYTKDPKDTAALIKSIASREQKRDFQDFSLRIDRKPLTTKEQQEFIIESLPGIGPSLAKSLLGQFKSVKKIVNTKPEDLQKIEKLGPKKAKEIDRILHEEYQED